jgi:hypothetical protein
LALMRAPIKVRRVNLVRVDDPAYVEEMSRQAAAHRRLGPRQDPGDLYRASRLVETAVRTWLAERLPLLDERIIDAELLPPGERAYVRRFQELDAVIGHAGEPERVVEMKFSANGSAVRRGISQLGRARALLRYRWPDVAGLLILVEANRTGVELDLDRLREVELVGPEALLRPGGLHPTTLVVLTAADLADHLDADARGVIERGHDQGDVLTAARLTRAARDSDPDDALGERHAPPGTPSQAPSASFDGGDGPNASPFAALAGLQLDGEDEADAPGGDG